MVYKCLRSETTDVHGLGQVKSCVFIVHRNPVWFFLEMRLLYVWYPDVGRGSRLGQWGTCSSSRGWIEGGRAGEVMWRLIGYTGWVPGCPHLSEAPWEVSSGPRQKSGETRVSRCNPRKTSRVLLQRVLRTDSPTMTREQ